MLETKLTQEQNIERCKILCVPIETAEHKWLGGTYSFDNLTAPTARVLMEKGYLDPEDCQNCSPSALEITDFCDLCSTDECQFVMHGYIVSNERPDRRITIEGVTTVEGSELSNSQKSDFIDMFRFADEFDYEHGYCWYD